MNSSSPNRLSTAVSPYLQQHAHNPVDWYPWGPEAFARARAENKPIFLSIGYAACHWCHVMAHEVFENPSLAALQNELFINIKVDREERPDLDELYMLATQYVTGSGGWPMSVWLTPELEPFYAGTYIPPVDAYGRPGFGKICRAISEAWKTREPELRQQATEIVTEIRRHLQTSNIRGKLNVPQALDQALLSLGDRFDSEHGGFGGAPKFPPEPILAFLLEMLEPEHQTLLTSANRNHITTMVTKTLDAMMRGGIFDHLAGGFARYSVDGQWLVPHFEKMLYDNAQLATIYASAGTLLNRIEYHQIARRTLDFCFEELRVTRHGTATPGFCSSLDADSEGQEGKYYIWTIEQIRAALPTPTDSELMIRYFNLTPTGNFSSHDMPPGAIGYSVLALGSATFTDAELSRIATLSSELRRVRAQRSAPARDEKVITAWNGLMISALAVAGRLLGQDRYLQAALATAQYLLQYHVDQAGNLQRISHHVKQNNTDSIVVDGPGFLEDYAYLCEGLLDLADALPVSSVRTWALAQAASLADSLLQDFRNPQPAATGGFFTTSNKSSDPLFARLKNASDGALPSPNGVALHALLRLSRYSIPASKTYRDAALLALAEFSDAVQEHPSMHASILQAVFEDQRQYGTLELSAASTLASTSEPPATTGLLTLFPNLLMGTTLQTQTGSEVTIALQLQIADGYHIPNLGDQPPASTETLLKARVEEDNTFLITQEWRVLSDHGSNLSGMVNIKGICQVGKNVRSGRYKLRVTLVAQPCSDAVCAPVEQLSMVWPLEIADG